MDKIKQLEVERDMYSKLYEGYKFSNSVIKDQRDKYKERVLVLEQYVERLERQAKDSNDRLWGLVH